MMGISFKEIDFKKILKSRLSVFTLIGIFGFLYFLKSPGNYSYYLSSYTYSLKTRFPETYYFLRGLKDELTKSNSLEIETFWHKVSKETVSAGGFLTPYENPETHGVPGGYVDLINNNLLLGVNGEGKMFTYSIKEKKFKHLESNLNDIYKDQNYKTKIIIASGRFGIRDIFIDIKESRILVSLWVDIVRNKGCYGMAIYEAKYVSLESARISPEKLTFKEFFKGKECKSNFSGHASGGRIKRLDEKIIFTLGDYDHSIHGDIRIPQDKRNIIGKIISIDNNRNFNVLSMGHRNPQGLLIKDGNIFITEHGPRGGDEINLINPASNLINHYGWPYYFYGFHYEDEDATNLEIKGEFINPLYYFSPSIAISEIIYYEDDEFPYWKNKFIVSSLKDKSLFLMDYDTKTQRFLSLERINIGHRIRDLIVVPNGGIILITDDERLIHLKNPERLL